MCVCVCVCVFHSCLHNALSAIISVILFEHQSWSTMWSNSLKFQRIDNNGRVLKRVDFKDMYRLEKFFRLALKTTE